MGRRIPRALGSLLLLSLALSAGTGEEALSRAERLRDSGKDDEAIAAAREALSSDAPAEVKGRAEYLIACVLDFRKADRPAALHAYRQFLAHWKVPRLTDLAQDRVEELERILHGPDGEVLREVEEIARAFPTSEPQPAIRRLRSILSRRPTTSTLARGWELLGDLQTDPRVADWNGAVEAYGHARAVECDERRREDIGHKIEHARKERGRLRIFHAGVAILSMLVSTTLLACPWRAARRIAAGRLLALLVPWAGLTAALYGLYVAEARDDPENPVDAGRFLLFAGAALVPTACSAILATSPGRAGRSSAPFASLLGMLGLIAVFCHHFDWFPVFGL